MLQLAFTLALLLSPRGEDPFRPLTFEQAQAAAAQEKKVILIDFFTTWCVPCKKLDATTWKDDAVQQWIGKQCVALKLDAEKDVELARRFQVEAYPTILLLKPDGSVIDRLVGYKDAQEFLSSATAALAGKDSLARAKEKLAGHERDPSAREDYGRELARAGKHEEALAQYLWCFDNGRATPAYGGVRLSFLLADIQQLAPHCPAAIQAMEERRDAAEARIRAGSNAFEDLADAVALNAHLNARDRSLALYDELAQAGPIPTRMRYSFFLELKDQLRSAKRYADLLGLLDDPVKYVAGQIQQYESVRKLSASSGEKHEEAQDSTAAFLRSNTLQAGALVYEALLATDRGPEADKVAESMIAFDTTGRTYAALIKLADRAGAAERVKALGERGLASLPEKEQAEVKKALARASKPK